MVDLPMKGFIKTWFQRNWGKVSVDKLGGLPALSFAVVDVYVKRSSTPLAQPVPCAVTREEES